MSKVSNYSRRRESAQNEGGADYAAKREELVRIAARLFKEQGYQATKLADIAREAGMDRATVYYYVGSKEEFSGSRWKASSMRTSPKRRS